MDSVNDLVLKMALKDFRDIKARSETNSLHDAICAQVSIDTWEMLGRVGVDFFYATFQTWPEFSGHHLFPVPCPNGGSPVEAYYDMETTYWDGAYGESRKRLLDHIISQFENVLEQRKAK